MSSSCFSACCGFIFGGRRTTELTQRLVPADEEEADAGTHAAAENKKLQNILQEVLVTERSYVASLDALVACLPIISPHLDALHGQELATAAAALQGVHKELLGRLQIIGADVIGSDADVQIGELTRAFVLISPYLRVYSTYCGGYTRAAARVASLRNDPAVAARLFAFETGPGGGGERVDSLLIKPVQRLCKYPLFFEQLLAAIPSSNASREELENAAAAVRRVSEEVNAQTQRASEGARMIELHVELGGRLPALLAPTRTLLLESEIRLAGRLATSRKRYLLVLLSDALVLASKRRRPKRGRPSLKLKAVLPLASLELELAPSAKKKPSAAAPLLLLQCATPNLRYLCKCGDAAASTQLLDGVSGAKRQLETSRRGSIRRASLAPGGGEAGGAGGGGSAAADCDGAGEAATESLLASARASRTASRLERGFRRKLGAAAAPSAAAAAAAVAAVDQEEESDQQGAGLVGVVLHSDEESSSESSSEAGSEWDD